MGEPVEPIREHRRVVSANEVCKVRRYESVGSTGEGRFEHMLILQIVDRNHADSAEGQRRADVRIARDGVRQGMGVLTGEVELACQDLLEALKHAPGDDELQRTTWPGPAGPDGLDESLGRRILPTGPISKVGGAPDIEIQANPGHRDGLSTTA